ncbi:hypothetical protein FNF31_02700 [Cafeteria roenbergensis]|uniref:4'-phosphopantetheinyl transferase domain-containing protein n=1 Tax=Cafeteria roenbergensis TaxID=33653 RepID=A0A5A8DEU4_CAFRO|nr:hypothetical protein FNF31_02700 [Cafeteria roenbergensis]
MIGGAVRSIGADVCHSGRVMRVWRRYGRRFETRSLHPNEVAALRSLEREGADEDRIATFLGGRWAAKEAVYKAVGGYRLLFPEIEVVAAAAAASDEVVRMPQPLVTLPLSGFGPRIKLHGASLAAAEAMGVKKVLLSLSHDASTIFAVAAALEAHGRS